MKKNTIKLVILVLALTTLLLGLVGVTFSYFQSTGEIVNEFQAGEYSTSAEETFVSPSNWLPGDTTEKLLNITNEGNVDMAVRVSYTEKWEDENGDDLPLETNGIKASIINFDKTSGWTTFGDGYYYYTKVLGSNEVTTSPIKSVTFNPEIVSDSSCSTTNGVTSCQTNYNGYENATYTLTFKVETIQATASKEEWNFEAGHATAMTKIEEAFSNSATTGVMKTQEGEEDIYYYTNAENANVLFNGYCWQIVRTTASGGIKIIYNGVAENNQCLTTRTAAVAVNGADATNTTLNGGEYTYGTRFTYAGDTFTITGDTINLTWSDSTYKDALGKYTCLNSTGTCTELYEVGGYISASKGYTTKYTVGTAPNYRTLGNTPFNAPYNKKEYIGYMFNIEEGDANKYNSSIKSYLESWYESNMTNVTRKLEDTTWCYDRTVIPTPEGGASVHTYYKEYNNTSEVHLTCDNIEDQYSVSNTKAKLDYPIGLLNNGEAILMGGTYRKTGAYYWLGSPYYFYYNYGYYAKVRDVHFGGLLDDDIVYYSCGARPSVSLLSGTDFEEGTTGTYDNPYVVK